MDKYAALLRGINVSGKNKIGMEPLRAMFTALGHRDVATYIQSGNVVFTPKKGSGPKLTSELERAIAKTFGLEIQVVVRRHAELAATHAQNAFVAKGADPSRLYVVFLGAAPSAEAIAKLDPSRSPPDELVVLGHDVYLHCPAGFGQTKLTIDYFERRLGTTATARNWNTVTKLLEMTT